MPTFNFTNLQLHLTFVLTEISPSRPIRFKNRCWNKRVKTSYLKRTRTAMKNVWKLQLLLMSVSSSMAIFPNIWEDKRQRNRQPGKAAFQPFPETHLHADHSVDEEDHSDEEANVRQGLERWKKQNRL